MGVKAGQGEERRREGARSSHVTRHRRLAAQQHRRAVLHQRRLQLRRVARRHRTLQRRARGRRLARRVQLQRLGALL